MHDVFTVHGYCEPWDPMRGPQHEETQTATLLAGPLLFMGDGAMRAATLLSPKSGLRGMRVGDEDINATQRVFVILTLVLISAES